MGKSIEGGALLRAVRLVPRREDGRADGNLLDGRAPIWPAKNGVVRSRNPELPRMGQIEAFQARPKRRDVASAVRGEG